MKINFFGDYLDFVVDFWRHNSPSGKYPKFFEKLRNITSRWQALSHYFKSKSISDNIRIAINKHFGVNRNK